MNVCRDPKASAQARATASATLLRAAGYFAKPAEVDEADKDDHELTWDELNARIRALDQRHEYLKSVLNDAENGAEVVVDDSAGVEDDDDEVNGIFR